MLIQGEHPKAETGSNVKQMTKMKYFYRGARKGDGEDPPETEIFFVENGVIFH